MKGFYLGPEFSDAEIEAELSSCGAVYKNPSASELIGGVVTALTDEKAVGWMQGRMKFGPTALGGRNIVADPRPPITQKQLNLNVKYLASFCPFAPNVLKQEVREWFEHATDNSCMLIVADVNDEKRRVMTEEEEALFAIDKLNVPRSSVPVITHVNCSARTGTVHADINPHFHAVISKFKENAGCPIVVNTSFNVRGEPKIFSPTDAFKHFMGTDLDVLAVGAYLLSKVAQDEPLRENHEARHELD